MGLYRNLKYIYSSIHHLAMQYWPTTCFYKISDRIQNIKYEHRSWINFPICEHKILFGPYISFYVWWQWFVGLLESGNGKHKSSISEWRNGSLACLCASIRPRHCASLNSFPTAYLTSASWAPLHLEGAVSSALEEGFYITSALRRSKGIKYLSRKDKSWTALFIWPLTILKNIKSKIWLEFLQWNSKETVTKWHSSHL